MSLSLFLKAAKQQFTKNGSKSAKVTLVTGNQSSDMDSVVSAISYSYFSHLRKEQDDFIYPFINIPRADLRLRRDIVHALEEIDLRSQDLVFADDLQILPKGIDLDLILVDHNALEGVNEEFMKQKFNTKVVGILDHHKDEGHYLDASPRIIKVVGSCSTLVLTYFEKEIKSSGISLAASKFICSAILLDTNNLKDSLKTTEDDIHILEVLQQTCHELNPQVLKDENKTLHKCKKSVDGFTFNDIIRKDYKEYICKNYRAGISSVGGSLDELETKYGWKTMQQTMKDWKKERQLNIFVMMNSYHKDDKIHRRQISFVQDDNEKLVSAAINALQNSLQLEGLLGIKANSVKAFEQLNTAASRKQVAPLVTEFLSQLE